MITLADGTIINTTDFQRFLEIVVEQDRQNNKVSSIQSKDGVTLKLDNLPVKEKIAAEHENFIESTYQDYKIRVWLYKKERMWGCNVIGKKMRYFEFYQDDYSDENKIISMMEDYIRDGVMR